MINTAPDNQKLTNEIAVLTLAALSFFSGCSQSSQNDQLLDARPSASATQDPFTSLARGENKSERRVVSLADASSKRVALDPKVSYVIEVPHGTFKEVADAVVSSNTMFSTVLETNDTYIFNVPRNARDYAIKVEGQDWCDRSRDEYDGTYILLINMADQGRVESAVKFPTNRSFSSNAKNHGKLVMIRSEEDGKVFEVLTPRILQTNDRHQVPEYIRYAHDQIFEKPLTERL